MSRIGSSTRNREKGLRSLRKSSKTLAGDLQRLLCYIKNDYLGVQYTVTSRHMVYISYHYCKDQGRADSLQSLYKNAIINRSMREDLSYLRSETILRRIRHNHLKDSTFTVMLIEVNAWGRKWVDWEINSSLKVIGGAQ